VPQQGDWYNWGVFRGGSNSFDAFKAAFRHVSGVVRSTGANVKIQQAYNSLNARGDGTRFQDQYVGDGYVDEICVSAYNFCGIQGRQWQNQAISDIIGPWYNAMTSITGKPLCIAEMSSTNHCNNYKAQWIRDTWNDLAYKFTRIQTVTWFLQDNWSVNEDLDLDDWNQITAWRDGANGFKAAVGYTQGDQAVAADQSDAKNEAAALKAAQQYQDELKKKGFETARNKLSAHANSTENPVSAGTTTAVSATLTTHPHAAPKPGAKAKQADSSNSNSNADGGPSLGGGF
jgi:hypothetical protein